MKIVQGSINRETSPMGVKISFLTRDVVETDTVLQSTQDKEMEAIIQPVKHHRSMDANAYMWVLCDKIAKAIHTAKEEIYRLAVKEVGAFDDIAIDARALPIFREKWAEKGLGWFTDVFVPPVDHVSRVRCYYGSSTYDSEQMARLVDYVVEEAKGLEIETLTPDELSRIEAAWR